MAGSDIAIAFSKNGGLRRYRAIRPTALATKFGHVADLVPTSTAQQMSSLRRLWSFGETITDKSCPAGAMASSHG